MTKLVLRNSETNEVIRETKEKQTTNEVPLINDNIPLLWNSLIYSVFDGPMERKRIYQDIYIEAAKPNIKYYSVVPITLSIGQCPLVKFLDTDTEWTKIIHPIKSVSGFVFTTEFAKYIPRE